jgi:hypothetical protein
VYYCLDLASNCLIISHHVSFDESSFPFAEKSNQIPSSDFDFLSEFNLMPLPIGSYFPSRASVGTSAPGDGSPLVATAPDRSTHLPKAIGPVAGCSAHLPRSGWAGACCSCRGLAGYPPLQRASRSPQRASRPSRTTSPLARTCLQRTGRRMLLRLSRSAPVHACSTRTSRCLLLLVHLHLRTPGALLRSLLPAYYASL